MCVVSSLASASRNLLLPPPSTPATPAVPRVRVTPHIQDLRPGEEAHMSCRATGEPFPKVCKESFLTVLRGCVPLYCPLPVASTQGNMKQN